MRPVVLGSLLLIAACAPQPVATAPLGAISLPPLDSLLARPCARPVKIADGLQSSGVDALWAADRAALDDCRDRHTALVVHDAEIARALAGQ